MRAIEKMAFESDMDLKLSELTIVELSKFMKEACILMEKKAKAETKQLEKVETKRAAAAPPKGKTPIQFLKNNAWVEFVLNDMLTQGWEEFTHTERMGKGLADVLYQKSELVPYKDAEGKEVFDEDGEVQKIFVFEGSVSKTKPNGDQPTLSHAMTVSRLYWSPATVKKAGSGSREDLYREFESQYVPPMTEEGETAKPTKKTVVRQVMTKEERDREKEEKQREKEEAKEQKRLEREAAKEQKRLEKEAEKEQKRLEREAAKASKAVVKIPARAVRGVVTSKGSPIAPAAQVVKAKAPLTVKAAVKPLAKPQPPQAAKTEWVPPMKGMSKPFQVGTVTYLRDHLNRLWTKDANGKPDECVGVWDEKTQSIDDENVPDE